MRRHGLLAVLLLFGGAWNAARAEEVPPPGAADARVRSVVFDENQVYSLNMAMRSAMEIAFADDEQVGNVAVGDSVSWEVAPSGHLLFIKPHEAAGPTNLIVTTTRPGGAIRVYHFELRATATSVGQRTGTIFALRFLYPGDAATRSAVQEERQRQAAAVQLEAQAVTFALDAAVTQGPRNLNYVLAGPEALAPSEVSDNGISTVLRFPRGQAIPAIYKVLPDGGEALINFDVRGEFVILHEVVKEMRLRLGKSLVCIWNEAGERPQVGDLSTGTVSPDVLRKTETH